MKSKNALRSPILYLVLLTIILPMGLMAQEERYDAPYLSVTREYTLNADGSIDYRYIKEQKLLTYRAFHNLYGETFVVYDTAFQKLKINEVFTIMADGKKVAAPANSFNEVLPGYAAHAPAYNSLREMVITHTGLERGAMIHLDYTLHTAKGTLPALMGNELLAENEPIKTLTVRMRVPAGSKPEYRLLNSTVTPQKSTDGKYDLYTWTMTDVAAIAAEENQPGGNERYPRICFSTGSRDAMFAYLTGQPAFALTLSDAMKKMVNNLTENQRNRFELALKLQERVVNDLRLTPVPVRTALYRCRTPEQVWNSNGGTAVEKAVLLTALLKFAGIEARVAAIARTACIDEKTASLADIEDFTVQVEDRDRGTWYLSVANLNPVNLKLTLPGRTFILLSAGEKVTFRKTETPKQVVKVPGTFIISSDPAITGEISIFYEGSVFPLAGMIRDRKKMKNSISGQFIGKDSADLKVSTLNNENGFQSYIVKNDKPFRKDSNFYYFTLPVSTAGIDSWGIKTLSQKRETPYEIPAIATESYTYTITLPATLKLFTPATKTEISNKAGSYTWEVKESEGKMTVRRQIEFKDRTFPAEVYPEFKALMDAWNGVWSRGVVFVTR